MALKDVKVYYLKIQDTYLSCKENEEELINEYKQGNISQEQVENYKQYVEKLKVNYDRLAYIMYLFNLPTRPSKRIKNNNSKLLKYFKDNKATEDYIQLENTNILTELQKIIKGDEKRGD